MVQQQAHREATLLISSRYLISKLDTWTIEEKVNYYEAYNSSDWVTVYSMTSDFIGSAYTLQLTLEELWDVLTEYLTNI